MKKLSYVEGGMQEQDGWRCQRRSVDVVGNTVALFLAGKGRCLSERTAICFSGLAVTLHRVWPST